jgi:hypothetical protein
MEARHEAFSYFLVIGRTTPSVTRVSLKVSPL